MLKSIIAQGMLVFSKNSLAMRLLYLFVLESHSDYHFFTCTLHYQSKRTWMDNNDNLLDNHRPVKSVRAYLNWKRNSQVLYMPW